jgi:hypothetical protein
MKAYLFIILGILLCSIPSQAEKGENEEKQLLSFDVLVIDAQTEEPIPAARILIGKKELEAYTDFDGLAHIEKLPEDLYDIEISFISYQKHYLNSFRLDASSNRLIVKLQQ